MKRSTGLRWRTVKPSWAWASATPYSQGQHLLHRRQARLSQQIIGHIRYSNNTLPHFLTLGSKDRANLLAFLNFQNFIDMPYQREVQASFLRSCGLSEKGQNLANKSILVHKGVFQIPWKKSSATLGEKHVVSMWLVEKQQSKTELGKGWRDSQS